MIDFYKIIALIIVAIVGCRNINSIDSFSKISFCDNNNYLDYKSNFLFVYKIEKTNKKSWRGKKEKINYCKTDENLWSQIIESDSDTLTYKYKNDGYIYVSRGIEFGYYLYASKSMKYFRYPSHDSLVVSCTSVDNYQIRDITINNNNFKEFKIFEIWHPCIGKVASFHGGLINDEFYWLVHCLDKVVASGETYVVSKKLKNEMLLIMNKYDLFK